ncbi:MAG: hypothetical protein GY796_21400, partial [Chloroflexi bacterium]|nr:hypothetical protein [Chloroflexota bacterium]
SSAFPTAATPATATPLSGGQLTETARYQGLAGAYAQGQVPSVDPQALSGNTPANQAGPQTGGVSPSLPANNLNAAVVNPGNPNLGMAGGPNYSGPVHDPDAAFMNPGNVNAGMAAGPTFSGQSPEELAQAQELAALETNVTVQADLVAFEIMTQVGATLEGYRDPQQAFEMLQNLPPEGWPAVEKAFSTAFDTDFDTFMKESLRGVEVDQYEAIKAGDVLKADALALFNQVHVGGGDPEFVANILRNHPDPAGVEQAFAEFFQSYNSYDKPIDQFGLTPEEVDGYSLRFHLERYLGGANQDRFNALLEGNTELADAFALKQAIENKDLDAVQQIYALNEQEAMTTAL